VKRGIYTASASSPGADLAAEYAAGYAAAAFLFRSLGETAYADRLWGNAKQALAFAKAYPSK
jgi:endoglucanase